MRVDAVKASQSYLRSVDAAKTVSNTLYLQNSDWAYPNRILMGFDPPEISLFSAFVYRAISGFAPAIKAWHITEGI